MKKLLIFLIITIFIFASTQLIADEKSVLTSLEKLKANTETWASTSNSKFNDLLAEAQTEVNILKRDEKYANSTPNSKYSNFLEAVDKCLNDFIVIGKAQEIMGQYRRTFGGLPNDAKNNLEKQIATASASLDKAYDAYNNLKK